VLFYGLTPTDRLLRVHTEGQLGRAVGFYDDACDTTLREVDRW
jgi:hypothetical protein